MAQFPVVILATIVVAIHTYKNLDDSLFALTVSCTDFFITWQAERFHTLHFARLLCF
jgi:hypothetical protein